MKKTIVILLAIAGLILLIAVPTCSSYNGMVTVNESVDQSWAEVQNQYQRRLDLIPNLVETVKGYAAHESSTLENVTNARAGVAKADTALNSAYNAAVEARSGADMQAYANAQNELNRQLSIYVNAVREAYPDLKANENFLNLQAQLEGTENRIEYARKNYTEAVKDYNLRIRRFPGSIVAGIFGFQPREQFQAEEAAQKAPKVNF